MTLARLDPGEHLLLIDLPALCSDAAGLWNLAAEIVRHYEAQGRDGLQTDEPLQYVDAAAWLNDMLTSEDGAAGRDFWRGDEFAPLGSLRLAFDADGHPGRPFTTERVPVPLSPSTRTAFETAGVRFGVSMEALLAASLQSLLQRATNDTRAIVGFVWDGRSHAELEAAIGLFARALPVSGVVPTDAPFVEALRQVNDRMAQARKWGPCLDPTPPSDGADNAERLHVPFLVEHDAWPDPWRTGDVQFDVVACDARIDRFKLKLVWQSRPGRSHAFLEYDANAFVDTDMAYLADQLAVLIDDALANPDRSVGALQVTSPSQHAELLSWATAADESCPASECVHRLFEEVAGRRPDATAVVCGGERLSYGTLNARANQLARRLRDLGVAPGVLVGLCLDRSAEMIVGILGILKAGGAYVPLDPRLPVERLRNILDDSGTTIAVTDSGRLACVRDRVRAVLLDSDRPALDLLSPENLPEGATPADLVYVLFTSGSTGRPKGVPVEHRQLTHYVRAIGRRLDVPEGTRFATVTTFAADLGNTSVYPSLLGAGCLHVFTESESADPAAFGASMQQNEIDVLKIVPSHLTALLSGADPARLLPRARLVLGGEACPWDLVDRVRHLAPDLVVFNHYGPTETTVGATTYRCGCDEGRRRSGTVPIGRPLADVVVRVLDRGGRLAPRWCSGELYIGGPGVARGYLNRPDWTADRFVSDAFSGDGARLYRTGDQVRVLPGGDLEFLGRTDDQVKIRGFRVELGEVEAVLRRHASVGEATILVRDGDRADARLIGCVVARPGSTVQAAELSTFVKDRLPDYMVPAAFVALDRLPLTANGKIDRTALSAIAERAVTAAAQSERPSTAYETIVADIWRELLDVDEIGLHDNFYDLGGHSLMAIQVVTALEKRTQLQVSPRDLVFHTLKQFAALCESRLAKTSD